MKYKTTRKAIVSGSANIVYAGCCDLQNLLVNHDAVAYTAGVYGWNFDVFEVYGLTICTGYRNMPGRRANNIAEYEKKAREIRENYDFDRKTKTDAIENLLKEFCEQA